jgi:hypothetical protein
VKGDDDSEGALAAFVFGGTGPGVVLGFIGMDIGFGLAGAALHVIGGFLAAASTMEGRLSWRHRSDRLPGDGTPAWVEGMFRACVVAGVAIYVALRLY